MSGRKEERRRGGVEILPIGGEGDGSSKKSKMITKTKQKEI